MGKGKERLLLSMKKLLHGFVHCFDGGYAFMDVCSQYSSTLNMYHLSYVCYIACQLYFNRAVKKDYFLKTEYTTHPPPKQSRLPQWLSGKEPACSEEDTGNTSLIPRLGRSPEEGMTTHSSILAWRIPWTEKTGRLQSKSLEKIGHN